MNEHTDLEVIKKGKTAIPALIKKTFADWKTFRLLMEQADDLVEHHDTMWKIRNELDDYAPSGEPGEKLARPPSAKYLRLDDWMKKKIARCGAWLDKIDTEDLYDTDEQGDRVLKKMVIADRLAMILATLVGEPSNPKAALSMILQHVFDAEISYPALESGCREVEAGAKPFAHRNPGELLKVFSAHEEKWNRRREAIRGIEELTADVLESVPRAQARFALAEAKHKARAATYFLQNASSWLQRAAEMLGTQQKACAEATQRLDAAMTTHADAKQKLAEAAAIKQAADEALAALEQGGKCQAGDEANKEAQN